MIKKLGALWVKQKIVYPSLSKTHTKIHFIITEQAFYETLLFLVRDRSLEAITEIL